MALLIESDCINCDMCEPECPNEAIYYGEIIYEIDPNKCTECVGHYDIPQCIEVCPIDCIINDPEHKESPEQLLNKFSSLYNLG
ncbi:MAG: ferredoxin [Proteobacteria bacterium]|nr:MAG: ferredoxin [Pseudomonadota bacterium]